jgi:hypothetical protein
MKISDPKAKYGDKVNVLNYRFKPARWDEGECRAVQYKCGYEGERFSWQYDVYIPVGKGYFVYVGDDGISMGCGKSK